MNRFYKKHLNKDQRLALIESDFTEASKFILSELKEDLSTVSDKVYEVAIVKAASLDELKQLQPRNKKQQSLYEWRLFELNAEDLKKSVSNITADAWLKRREIDSYNAVGPVDAKYNAGALNIKFECSSTNSGTKKYKEEIKLFDTDSYLEKLFNEKSWAEQKKIMKEMFQKCDIQVHSDDPSFYWQGFWEDLAKNDLAVYPFKGKKGSGSWSNRHYVSGGLKDAEIRITKHLYDLMILITEGSDNDYKHLYKILETIKDQFLK